MPDLESKLRPVAESLLDQDEELRGVCIATQSSLFKGRAVALVATERRLIVQGLTRKLEPDDEPISISPERLADAKAEGAGGGWADLGAAVMDNAAVTLKLRTTDGEKLKLMMMRGTGPLGKLGGGEVQRQGVEAVGAWFQAQANRSGLA